jgi:hypothetical protein
MRPRVRSLTVPLLTRFEREEPLGLDPDFRQGFRQLVRRIAPRFVGQREGPPMNAERLPRPAVLHDPHRLGGIDVLVLHEPAWRVSADRQHGDINNRKPTGKLKENPAITIAGVAGDIDDADRRREHIAAPKRHSPVDDGARRPVVGGVQLDRDASADLDFLAPVTSLDDDLRPAARDHGVVAEWGDDTRPIARPQPLHRRYVEMVVMVVRKQHDVDWGQLLERDPRRVDPLRSRETKWAGAFRPHRVWTAINSAAAPAAARSNAS